MRTNIDPIRSLRFRIHRLRGWIALQRPGIILCGRVDAIGVPIIDIFPGSSICLGRNISLVSESFATALGVNHPVVLRTLRPGSRIEIGANVGISGGSICAAELIRIGDESMLGANVTIADTDFHALGPQRIVGHQDPAISVATVSIGKRVFIGTGAVVLKGVTIGDNVVIGAGSVVVKNVPANTIAAGNPCRVIRELRDEEFSSRDVFLEHRTKAI